MGRHIGRNGGGRDQEAKLTSGRGGLGCLPREETATRVPGTAAAWPVTLALVPGLICRLIFTALSLWFLLACEKPLCFSFQEGKRGWTRKDSVGERCALTKESSMEETGSQIYACCILLRLEKHLPFSVGTRKRGRCHWESHAPAGTAQEAPGFRERSLILLPLEGGSVSSDAQGVPSTRERSAWMAWKHLFLTES